MKIGATVFALAVMLPSLAAAQDSGKYLCTQGELQRRVEILRETGVQVPCEVHYYKDSEAPGEQQVLWRAQNQAGYCEEQTEAFVARLQNLGWNCSAAAGAEAIPEPGEEMPADDTALLAPATEEEQQ